MARDEKSTYYDAGGIETLDIIKAKLTYEQYQGYLLGNALKYQCRMMHKSSDLEGISRDAEKAANYSNWLCELITPFPVENLCDDKQPMNAPERDGRNDPLPETKTPGQVEWRRVVRVHGVWLAIGGRGNRDVLATSKDRITWSFVNENWSNPWANE